MLKLPATYWPSSVMLAVEPPSDTVSVPLALALLVGCIQLTVVCDPDPPEVT